jgi:RNA recognition motif-containing protein
MLTYNQNGTSRGIASIIFNKADTAAKATKELNGLLVDGRPMKVNLLLWLTAFATMADLSNRSRSFMMRLTFPPSPPPSL